MRLILLDSWDLAGAATLVVLLGAVSWRAQLGVSRALLVSGARMIIQLTLVGFVLEVLFAYVALPWVVLMAFCMLAAAGREVHARQRRSLRGWWGYGIGVAAMFASSFTSAIFSLTVLIRADPWYQPQYAIPLLGMLLGNTMTGVALTLDRLNEGAAQQRDVIEARLMLGHAWSDAIADVRRESVRSGMIPTINGMAAAGIVSLPGMMTGQILAGSPPAESVKYQILIFLMISAGTGFGTLLANALAAHRLFDERGRLRLDRLHGATVSR